MKNLEFKRTVKIIRCDFTADDWSLYGMRGRGTVARKLNSTLKKCINSDMKYHETYKAMMDVMMECVDYGAMDSEPFQHLDHVLDILYGEDVQRGF